MIRSIKFRDNLYNRLKLLPLESELHHTTKINLTTCNKILQKSIRAAKFSYYNDQFTKYKSDSRKTWSTISSIMSRKNNGKNHPDYFLLNNARISDKKNIAEKFNTFFTNIGPKLSNEIPAPQGISYKTFLKQKISCAFNFNLVEVKDIIDTINKLAPKSSCGYDNISTKLLKQLSPIVSPFITVIINQSLCTGIFPDKLKIAKVLPLFKKGNIHLFDNYRPISLLPSISKVFEKIVYKQVYDYFLTHKLIYNSQYGFRHLHSTELAALELSDRLMQNLDKGKIPIAVYLDLSKAFDTLDHYILLEKLMYYGIKGTELSWFQSYLSNRRQYVHFDDSDSSLLTISTGVPQGSILGPLLFLIYMNDISEASDKFYSILYADDTTLTEPLCSFDVLADSRNFNRSILTENINRELKAIHIWLCVNKLSLNIPKTKFMIFHHKQRKIDNFIPELKINDYVIERVCEFNFLGLIIDESLSWNAHIQKVSNKISRTLGTLNRLKRLSIYP